MLLDLLYRATECDHVQRGKQSHINAFLGATGRDREADMEIGGIGWKEAGGGGALCTLRPEW